MKLFWLGFVIILLGAGFISQKAREIVIDDRIELYHKTKGCTGRGIWK